jgi:hypothetical protein
MSSFSVKRVSKVAIVVVVVAAVATGGKLLYDNNLLYGPLNAEAKMLEERREAATKIGLPMKPEDIDTEERMKGLALHEDFMKFQDYLSRSPEVLDLLTDESKADEAAVALLKVPEQVNNLLAASKLGNVNTPIDWEGGLHGSEPMYTSYNRYVQAACAIASYQFRQGDKASALKFITASADLTTQLTDEPTWKAFSSWASCSSRVVRTAFAFAKGASNDAEFVAGIAAALDRINPPTDFKQVIRGDSLRFVMTARKWEAMSYEDKMDLQLQNEENKIEPPTGDNASRALESKSLWFWVEAMKTAASEDANLFDVGVAIDNIGGVWLINEDAASYLARSFGITYEQTAMGIMRVVQIKNLTLTALEVLAHWHSDRALPDQISGDKPIHMDPVTGKPLHYAKRGNGFVLQILGNHTKEDALPPVADLRPVPGQGPALTFDVS